MDVFVGEGWKWEEKGIGVMDIESGYFMEILFLRWGCKIWADDMKVSVLIVNFDVCLLCY